MTFAISLRAARRAAKMTQGELGRKVRPKITSTAACQMISRWELGVSVPPASDVRTLERVLAVDLYKLARDAVVRHWGSK